MNAQDRMNLQERSLLVSLASSNPKALDYAGKNKLPANPAKWTLDSLQAFAQEQGQGTTNSVEAGGTGLTLVKDEGVTVLEEVPAPERKKAPRATSPKHSPKWEPEDAFEEALQKTVKTKPKSVLKLSKPKSNLHSAKSAIAARHAPKPKKIPYNKPRTSSVTLKREPKPKLQPVKAWTKAAKLIALLNRPEGVTIKEASTALSKTGAPVNARGWITQLALLKGYGITSRAVNGETRYFLVLPKGVKKPWILGPGESAPVPRKKK